MKRMLPVLLLASAAAAFQSAPAAAQASPELRNPNIVVDYIKPRKPEDRLIPEYRARMAKYQRFVKIYERVTQRQVEDSLAGINTALAAAGRQYADTEQATMSLFR